MEMCRSVTLYALPVLVRLKYYWNNVSTGINVNILFMRWDTSLRICVPGTIFVSAVFSLISRKISVLTFLLRSSLGTSSSLLRQGCAYLKHVKRTNVQTACLARVIAPIARPDMTRTRMTLQGGTQARNMGGTAWNKSADGASFLARSFAHRSYFGMTYGTGLPRVFKVCRGNSGLSRHSSSHLVDSAFLQAPTTP